MLSYILFILAFRIFFQQYCDELTQLGGYPGELKQSD